MQHCYLRKSHHSLFITIGRARQNEYRSAAMCPVDIMPSYQNGLQVPCNTSRNFSAKTVVNPRYRDISNSQHYRDLGTSISISTSSHKHYARPWQAMRAAKQKRQDPSDNQTVIMIPCARANLSMRRQAADIGE